MPPSEGAADAAVPHHRPPGVWSRRRQDRQGVSDRRDGAARRHPRARGRRSRARDRARSAASLSTAARRRRATCSSRSPARRTTASSMSARRSAHGAAAIVAERGRRRRPRAFVKVADARAALALAAARFFPRQPETIVAVTGTSGKTSVAAFVRQIWAALGREAASLGTIGIVSRPLTAYGSLTTPDPIALHETLDRLAASGRDASGDGGLLARPRPAAPRRRAARGRRLHQSLARPHGLSRDASRTISRRSCGCSASFCRRARRRSSTPTATIAPRVIEAARGARPRVMTVGAKGEAIRLARVARDGLSLAARARIWRPPASRAAAAAGRFPDLQCAGRRRPLHRDRQRGRRGVQGAAGARRRAGAAGAGRRASAAPRCSSTTRTSPTRSRRRWRRCGPSCAAG